MSGIAGQKMKIRQLAEYLIIFTNNMEATVDKDVPEDLRFDKGVTSIEVDKYKEEVTIWHKYKLLGDTHKIEISSKLIKDDKGDTDK